MIDHPKTGDILVSLETRDFDGKAIPLKKGQVCKVIKSFSAKVKVVESADAKYIVNDSFPFRYANPKEKLAFRLRL